MMCFVVWKAVAAAVRNSTMEAWQQSAVRMSCSVLHSGWIPVVTSQLTAAWVDSTWNVAFSTKPVSFSTGLGTKSWFIPRG